MNAVTATFDCAALRRRVTQRLQAIGAGAALEADLLLAHLLGVARAQLYGGRIAAPDAAALAALDALVARRLAGEPLAYLLGDAEFHALRLAVGPGVLTPRADSELLVDWSLELLRERAAPLIADAGSGSGCIALALAQTRSDAEVLAVERSAAARVWAARNIAALGQGRVRLIAGDWLRALAPGRFDLVVANPPYVREHDPRLDAEVARFEPAAALYAGSDGLDDLRRLCAQAPTVLRAGGWLLLEHAPDQGAAVRALLVAAGFAAVETRADLAGRARASGGRLASGGQ